jgi:hypothetical protein
MNRAQRMDAWFGRIWVAPEVVALMANEYDDEKVAALGKTKQQVVEEAGSPLLKTWLERHYDSKVFREARKEGTMNRSVISEYSMLSAESPHEISRVRLTTWPKKTTDVTFIGEDEPRSVM